MKNTITLRNTRLSFKGLKLFGLVITTVNKLKNINIDAEEIIIDPLNNNIEVKHG